MWVAFAAAATVDAEGGGRGEEGGEGEGEVGGGGVHGGSDCGS